MPWNPLLAEPLYLTRYIERMGTGTGDMIKRCRDVGLDEPEFALTKGEYHYRNGSTKQELKGAALDRFLLQKQGKHWDGVPVPRVGVGDFQDESFNIFRTNATKSGRVSDEVLAQSNALLIDNLNLEEGDYLKRAAILLFHNDPEKWVVGAYIKIGYFRTDADLLYQNDIHGSLFVQAEKAMDLLLNKYLQLTFRRSNEYSYYIY